jgi:hypothetical protein
MQLLKFRFIFVLLLSSPGLIYSFQDNTHQNIAEDAILFLETQGSSQQRWAADFFQAKLGGRDNSDSIKCWDDESRVTRDKWNARTTSKIETQCGLLGYARLGSLVADYARDTFFKDTWGFYTVDPVQHGTYTSYWHFMPLQTQNKNHQDAASLNTLKTDVYNDIDGYSANNMFGYSRTGNNDQTVALAMNNGKMTIDLPNCTQCFSSADGVFSVVPNPNPAENYRQGSSPYANPARPSSTPLGLPTNDGYKVAADNGSNYNCFADTLIGNCPDSAAATVDTQNPYKIPNTQPGISSSFTSGQDWAVFEPVDNVMAFFYHQLFLEGDQNRNSTFECNLAIDRYYTLPHTDFKYLATLMHWAEDMNQQTHVWATSDYNHGPYETFVDGQYGQRVAGGAQSVNYENFGEVAAYYQSRMNKDAAELDFIVTETAFMTYLVRQRAGYDTMYNSDDLTFTTAAKYGINQGITSVAILFEKAMLDLRRHRIHGIACP